MKRAMEVCVIDGEGAICSAAHRRFGGDDRALVRNERQELFLKPKGCASGDREIATPEGIA